MDTEPSPVHAVQAYAKVNLTLDVLGRREDGYHDLCSVMQEISLHDDVLLELGTGEEWKLYCNALDVPCDETNLAWKAARVFFDRVGREPNGLTVRITKRIPSQAGLGGGSSDAAAVLRLLNEHYGTPLSVSELCALGAQVGSDVPFCVLGGTALAEGRGERLKKLPAAPKLYFAVCKPDAAFSTPKLYAKLDEITVTERPDTEGMCEALRSGDKARIGEGLCNVFEQAVSGSFPALSEIKSVLLACGALGAQMTGSGSAVFGIFADECSAKKACKALDSMRVFFAETV